MTNRGRGSWMDRLGEYTGEESERHRPEKLTEDAGDVWFQIILFALGIALLIGPISGILLTYVPLLLAIDWATWRMRPWVQGRVISWLVMGSLFLGGLLSFYGIYFRWPLQFTYSDGELMLRFLTENYTINSLWDVARWIAIIFMAGYIIALVNYLSRILNEVARPNALNSIKARPAQRVIGMIFPHFVYDQAEQDEDVNDGPEADELSDRLDPWRSG